MGNLFGKSPGQTIVQQAPAPTVTPPPTMPDPMSPEAMDAQRRAARAANTGGRQSTILTTPGNRTAQPGTLAGGNYSGARLGAA